MNTRPSHANSQICMTDMKSPKTSRQVCTSSQVSANTADNAMRRVILAVREGLEVQLPDLPSPVNGPLLIAFSGGPDSMALALACLHLKIPFSLAHLNHGLRPESASETADNGPIMSFARRIGVQCIISHADVSALAKNRHIGIEEAGRVARFAFLEQTRQTTGAQWIALGHQADDLLEDILLRLIRGTSWPALAGMHAVDTNRRIIRPLLKISRPDIELFVRRSGFQWIHDNSNDSDAFRRNRLRHHVTPHLFQENPALRQCVLHLWEQARDDEAFWQSYLAPLLAQAVQTDRTLKFPERIARSLPKAARLRLLARLLQIAAPQAQVRADTLFRLNNTLMSSLRPRHFQFPGCSCTLCNGCLSFSIQPPSSENSSNSYDSRS